MMYLQNELTKVEAFRS